VEMWKVKLDLNDTILDLNKVSFRLKLSFADIHGAQLDSYSCLGLELGFIRLQKIFFYF